MAEVLRRAGVKKNLWSLPAGQSVYHTTYGHVVQQGQPLVNGTFQIPDFNRESLVQALRTDQAGNSSFPEFLEAAWKAGVTSYEVDFEKREVLYCGSQGESYIESYPSIDLNETTPS